MNLTIDIGNSFAKVAVFDKNQIIDKAAFEILEVVNVEKIVNTYNEIDKCILSSVKQPDESLIDYLQYIMSVCIELNGFTPLPFQNLYESKATQGCDRVAAIAGAQIVFPGKDVLVIDAGTTITFDFLDANGIYRGGNISPGMETRFKALHTFTLKLPLLSKREVENLLGRNTNQAIESGVQSGIIYEIEGYISALKKDFRNLKIILTGGDADFFANKFKNIIFVEPNLVLIGLNSILEYNVSKISN